MTPILTTEDLVAAYQEKTPNSVVQFERARQLLPGGVSRNTGFRLPHPTYMERGEGKYLYDMDGNRYVDFAMNYGPNLLGHNPGPIIEQVQAALNRGFGLGAPTQLEAKAAERALAMIPYAEKIRFLNTGTEATLHMIRAARALTGRERIVKFEGAYHGSHDTVMLSVWPPSAGPQPQYQSVPQTEGIPNSETIEVLAVPYNDPGALARCLAEYQAEVAAVVLDPGMNGCGLAQPAEGFLQEVARQTREHGALLLFDEVVTGFRYAPGGAQEHFGIQADLCAYGKSLGGGAPIGAMAGPSDMMSVFDIDVTGRARVPHSGTFNANLVALSAMSAFLKYIAENPAVYEHVNRLGEMARVQVGTLARRHRIPLLVAGAQSMFQVHFGIHQLRNYQDFVQRDLRFRKHLHWHMAVLGMNVPPSGTFFTSTTHTEDDVAMLVDGLEHFLVEHYLPLISQERMVQVAASNT
jgi:glutamate-1-semialdehyde 2,1-aminomutase